MAQFKVGAHSYDFHADRDVLGLIEVNTNAGGAMLNALLARAERRSCPGLASLTPSREAARAFDGDRGDVSQ